MASGPSAPMQSSAARLHARRTVPQRHRPYQPERAAVPDRRSTRRTMVVSMARSSRRSTSSGSRRRTTRPSRTTRTGLAPSTSCCPSPNDSASTSTPHSERSTKSSLRPTTASTASATPTPPHRAARCHATRAAGSAMNTHYAPRGHGRDHDADGLRRHQRHLEHRNRGNPHARRPHSDATPRPQLRQEAGLTPP